MQGFLIVLFEELFSWLLNESPKSVRYVLMTILEIFLIIIFVLGILIVDSEIFKLFLSVLIIVFLVAYIYIMHTISKSKSKKEKKIRKK